MLLLQNNTYYFLYWTYNRSSFKCSGVFMEHGWSFWLVLLFSDSLDIVIRIFIYWGGGLELKCSNVPVWDSFWFSMISWILLHDEFPKIKMSKQKSFWSILREKKLYISSLYCCRQKPKKSELCAVLRIRKL